MHKKYLALLFCFLLSSFAYAEVLVKPADEINYLLATVEESGCKFIRNGNAYSSAEAKAHLLNKYTKAKNKIKTAEQFIEFIATKSSVSGEPYFIECAGFKVQSSAEWLKEKLLNFRANRKAKTKN